MATVPVTLAAFPLILPLTSAPFSTLTLVSEVPVDLTQPAASAVAPVPP